MDSEASHDKAIPLFKQAIEAARTLHIPGSFIGNLFHKAVSYPGYLMNRISNSTAGKVVVSFTAGAIGTILLSRLKRYLNGDPNMQNARDFFRFPRAQTFEDLRNYGAGFFTNLWRRAFAAPWRLTTEHTRAWKRFRKLKLNTTHSHVITRSKPLLRLIKTGTAAVAGSTLGAAGLKLAANFFRRLYHRN